MPSSFLTSKIAYSYAQTCIAKTIFNNDYPNRRFIIHLGSATGKKFNIYFLSSPKTRFKRELFLQVDLQEREYLDLGYVSLITQNYKTMRKFKSEQLISSELQETEKKERMSRMKRQM